MSLTSKKIRAGLPLLFLCLCAGMLAAQQGNRGQRGRQGEPPDRRGAGQQTQAGRRGADQVQGQAWELPQSRGGIPQSGQANRGSQQTRPGILPQSPPARAGAPPAGGALPTRPGLPRAGQPNRPSQSFPADPPSMRLRLEGETLTAEIRNTPLQNVLDELAAWSGVVFEIESQVNPPVSVNFYGVSLTEAVDRLTANNNSLIYYGQDANGDNRMRLVRILTRNPRPTPPVIHYLGTGSVTKRSDDIVDSPEQALAVLAGSKNLDARQKAIEVLVSAKSPAAVPALKSALSDPAVEVKVAALDGLASLGAKEALPQVLQALRNSHPGVRQSAILAVAALGDAANARELRPLLKDPDASVAALAEVTILKLTARDP